MRGCVAPALRPAPAGLMPGSCRAQQRWAGVRRGSALQPLPASQLAPGESGSELPPSKAGLKTGAFLRVLCEPLSVASV